MARVVKHYLMSQVESGVMCPITMTFAAVPSLRQEPELASEWVPRITSTQYDPILRAPGEKSGCMMGMAMTEKQGGSDVRANTTRAEAVSDGHLLTGHKFFCSAPMCDAFLTLAQTHKGLTCFLVPRILPDGTKNRIHIQRLKDKLGNRSNASSEIEYQQTFARRVGEEGRGVPTIIEMVSHTRLDCIAGTSGMMRQALVQALHHTTYRSAFGKVLRDQPLMRSVLADLALEWEGATAFLLRLARGYDEGVKKPESRNFVRIATAISKYWVCKRGPHMAFEAMECLGGSGYVEERIMPRIYREMPVSSIWEGSGNVMALDVLRAMQKSPEAVDVLLAELRLARGADRRFDRHLQDLESELSRRDEMELRARTVVEKMALALQSAQLLRFAPAFVSDAFCASRLDAGGYEYGTLPLGLDLEAIVDRAWPRGGNLAVGSPLQGEPR